jgi:hypothetical protein
MSDQHSDDPMTLEEAVSSAQHIVDQLRADPDCLRRWCLPTQ